MNVSAGHRYGRLLGTHHGAGENSHYKGGAGGEAYFYLPDTLVAVVGVTN